MTEEDKFKTYIRSWIYLSPKLRYNDPANNFPKETIKALAKKFADIYNKNVLERTDNIKVTQKERDVLNHCFMWCICSPNFKGDLIKGIYLASNQGFGKDIILKTIVDFYAYFEFIFEEYTFPDFCNRWFENDPYKFKSPIKINDIKGVRKMKREKESIPFLELLDFREQLNNRRSLLVSSNVLPADLQDQLESGEELQRLEERIKECFNVIIVEGVESKRIENKITI